MALVLRRGLDELGRAALAMPLEQYAKQETPAHLDAADGSGPEIGGAAGIIRGIQIHVSGASAGVAEKVERNSRSEFKRLGIDLRESEPKFGKLIEGWRAENVDRAKSLAEFERDKLSEILAKGSNKTTAELRRTIQDRIDVSRSKADLLARDQVLKLNAKVTRGPEVEPAAGPDVKVIAGRTVSTVHDRVAGEASTRFAASIARTANVCAPCASDITVYGDVQAANAAASTRHSNRVFCSFDVNVKLALAVGAVPVGPPVIVVSGGVRSTAHVRVAGVGSKLPTTSRTRTAKACVRSARFV